MNITSLSASLYKCSFEKNVCSKIFFKKRLAKFREDVILVSEVKRGDESEEL